MIKVAVLACILSVAHCGVVPAIPQQYLQQQGAQAYQGAPVLPPQLAAQVRALPPPVFRGAAPQAGPQQAYQAAPQPQYQPAPQPQYQPAPQYQAAPVQYQAQPQQYRPQPGPAVRAQAAPPRRLPANTQSLDDPEDYDPNPSYNFGFDVKDDQFTNYQNRKEQREGDKISGSYSVVDSDGFIRTVTYTADPVGGFKAEVVREPTDIKVVIPTPPPAGPQYSRGSPAYVTQPAAAPQYARAPAQAAPAAYAPAPQQAYAPQPQAVKATYAQPLQYQG